MPIGLIVQGIAMLASYIAKKRAEARQQETIENQRQDQLRIQTEQNNQVAPGRRAQNAARGDLLAGVQDVRLSPPRGGPGVQGGTRPSLLSDNTRELGRLMSRDALTQQMAGPMEPTPIPQPSGLDTVLGAIGTAGSAYGTISDAYQQGQATNSTASNPEANPQIGGMIPGATSTPLEPPPQSQAASASPLAPSAAPTFSNQQAPSFAGWRANQRPRTPVNPRVGVRF